MLSRATLIDKHDLSAASIVSVDGVHRRFLALLDRALLLCSMSSGSFGVVPLPCSPLLTPSMQDDKLLVQLLRELRDAPGVSAALSEP